MLVGVTIASRPRMVVVAALAVVFAGLSGTAAAQDVTWTGLVNVSLAGTTLQKSSGCDGCGDAGARSLEEIDAAGGYVEFTINETNTFWLAGLSNGNTSPSYGGIDFAFRFNGWGSADVLQNGAYVGGDTSYAAGDVFRISVAYGRVQFWRNGTVIYTSQTSPTFPLVLDVVFGSMGASLRDGKLSHDLLGDPPPPPPPLTGSNVTWIDQVNVTVHPSVLQKTSGCGGCDDAGARSAQEIGAEGGYVEFMVGEMGTFWVAGLNNGNAGTSYADIDFGIRFNGAGTADVLESGVYRGGDVPYSVGDVFRITLSNGTVYYRHNGTVIYTSLSTPAYPLVLDTALGSMDATLYTAKLFANSGGGEDPPSGEGFLETAGVQQSRAKLTTTEIQAFLPAQKGGFRFPAPYNTPAVRLTDPGDCTDGTEQTRQQRGGGRSPKRVTQTAQQQDCVLPIGYSYWRRMNNHVGRPDILVLLGLAGKGPALFSVDKTTGAVLNVGPLFDSINDPSALYRASTAESWYFSAILPNIVYTTTTYGRELKRFNVETRAFLQEPPAIDLAECVLNNVCPSDSGWIHQAHSSDTDHVHSATVRRLDEPNGNPKLGCIVHVANATAPAPRYRFYPVSPERALDECQVDKSGEWLFIKEGHATGEDTRVINLVTGVEATTIPELKGAHGHSDLGWGYSVGADSRDGANPNSTTLIEFPPFERRPNDTQRPFGSVVHFNHEWGINAALHISHTNAKPGAPQQQFACGSNASHGTHRDEIVCFPLDRYRKPTNEIDVLVVAPVMTDLTKPGGLGSVDPDSGEADYLQRPKGNLDVTGEWFVWTSNTGGIGNRLDAYIVKVPKGVLMGN